MSIKSLLDIRLNCKLPKDWLLVFVRPKNQINTLPTFSVGYLTRVASNAKLNSPSDHLKCFLSVPLPLASRFHQLIRTRFKVYVHILCLNVVYKLLSVPRDYWIQPGALSVFSQTCAHNLLLGKDYSSDNIVETLGPNILWKCHSHKLTKSTPASTAAPKFE